MNGVFCNHPLHALVGLRTNKYEIFLEQKLRPIEIANMKLGYKTHREYIINDNRQCCWFGDQQRHLMITLWAAFYRGQQQSFQRLQRHLIFPGLIYMGGFNP